MSYSPLLLVGSQSIWLEKMNRQRNLRLSRFIHGVTGISQLGWR
ncbi:hypothetical protein HanPSC8_Chr05g0205191 [Helianthus annuus]|nr:hypothetical protein HanPSC8_Chr05g0205191 [Helianthus annuus]